MYFDNLWFIGPKWISFVLFRLISSIHLLYQELSTAKRVCRSFSEFAHKVTSSAQSRLHALSVSKLKPTPALLISSTKSFINRVGERAGIPA